MRALSELAGAVFSSVRAGEDGGSEASSAEAKLRLVQSLAEYTRPVCLLLRLGLLPQASSPSFPIGGGAPLLAYNPTEVGQFLAKLQLSNGAPVAEPPFITARIMAHLGSIDPEAVGAGELVYPPRRLDCLCGLWQSCHEGLAPVASLALLVFLLFDTVVVNALHDSREMHVVGQRVRLAANPASAEAARPAARAFRLVGGRLFSTQFLTDSHLLPP